MELDTLNEFDDKDKMQIEAQQQKQSEYTLIKSERKIPGLTLWSYNTMTGEIKPAKIEYSDTFSFLTMKPLHAPKVIVEKDCVYRQALNKKNMLKVLRRENIYH